MALLLTTTFVEIEEILYSPETMFESDPKINCLLCRLMGLNLCQESKLHFIGGILH